MSLESNKINLKRKSFTVTNSDESFTGAPLLQRITYPLVWARLTCNVRIIDLKEKHYDEALGVFKDHYLHEEVLCKASNLSEDEESVESMVDMCRFWIKDSTSLIAVLEGSDQVVGMLVAQVVNKLDHSRTFSRIRLTQGKALDKIIHIRCHINKMFDVFEIYEVEEYFRIHAITVVPQFRGKGIGMALMDSAHRLALLLRQKLIVGIFTSAQSQSLALKLGMESKLEINYSEWLINDEPVFEDPGAGNYSAMLMTMKMLVNSTSDSSEEEINTTTVNRKLSHRKGHTSKYHHNADHHNEDHNAKVHRAKSHSNKNHDGKDKKV